MSENNHNNNHNHNNNNKPPAPRPLTDLTKQGEGSIEAIRGAQNLIRQFGKQVEPALYSLLCDTQSETRATVDKALKAGGPAASAVLVPLLTSQFGIAPVIATMVSAVVLQAIATVGQEKMCRALAETSGPKEAARGTASARVPVVVKPSAPSVQTLIRDTPDDDAPTKTSSIRPVTTVIREPKEPTPPPVPRTTANFPPTPIAQPEPEPEPEAPAVVKPKRGRPKSAVKAEPKAKTKTKAVAKKKAAAPKKKAVAKKKTAK